MSSHTVLFTVPNQLGVAYNARILATIAGHIASAIGWTPADAASPASPGPDRTWASRRGT
jgi:hypothetical protein